MNIPDQMARIKELKDRQEQDKRELKLLKGDRGPCSSCGEEADYASKGERLCRKCYNKKRIAEAREKFVHLIGLKVVDVIVESGYYPLQGLKLEEGKTLKVEHEYDGDTYLKLTDRPRIGRPK